LRIANSEDTEASAPQSTIHDPQSTHSHAFNSQFAIRNSQSPLVLIRSTAHRQTVVAVDDVAAAKRVVPGQMLAQARALCADIVAIEHEPHLDQAALVAMARWLTKWTPAVGIADFGLPIADSKTKSTDDLARTKRFSQGEKLTFSGVRFKRKLLPLNAKSAIRNPQSAILLDLTGTDRLFGPADGIAERIAADLARLRITARVGVGPNVARAWANSFAALRNAKCEMRNEKPDTSSNSQSAIRNSQFIPRNPQSAIRNSLPLPALRLDADCIATLHHLGIHTVDQLRALPTDQLPARFGPQLMLRLAQYDGLVAEPIVPVRPFAPIAIRREWEFSVDSLEPLWPVLQELLDRVLAQLQRRGEGLRSLDVQLPRTGNAPPVERTIRLAAPTRNAKSIFALMRLALEHAAQEVLNARGRTPREEGFAGIRLRVTRSERIRDEQTTLVDDPDATQHADAVARLVETLRVRMGEQSVVRARRTECYLAEKAWEEDCELRIANCEMKKPSKRANGDASNSQFAFRISHFPTPLLLPPPTELRVLVAPSHDRDGRPVQIAGPRGGRPRRIVHAVGPHRVAPLWWTGHDKTRDYFEVEDETGLRTWVFRVCESNRWFEHGTFA
jgi:protein ImuB